MKMICLWLYLFNAGASLPVNPVGNIFKARAKTPIIAQAITDFQDICLTFALHESEVSIQDDMKHFTSMINHAGYEKRDLTQTEQAASIMSLQSPITAYRKNNDDADVRLVWKANSFQSCSLTTKLPLKTTSSDIETEILVYDEDWKDINDIQAMTSSNFTVFAPKGIHFQCVNFENGSLRISVSYARGNTHFGSINSNHPSLILSIAQYTHAC